MEPIELVGWSSKIGFQVSPPSVDFQTPPEAVGGVVGERIARHAARPAHPPARERPDEPVLKRGEVLRLGFLGCREGGERQPKSGHDEKSIALAHDGLRLRNRCGAPILKRRRRLQIPSIPEKPERAPAHPIRPERSAGERSRLIAPGETWKGDRAS